MSTPKFLLIFSVLWLLSLFLLDNLEIGTKKIDTENAARHTARIAVTRAVEEGGIRTKHQARIDLDTFQSEFNTYGPRNLGQVGFNSKQTYIYDAKRLTPFAAIQMAIPMESKSMKYLLQTESVWHYPKHRVLFIWDEKS